MGERVNIGAVAFGLGAGATAAGRAFSASLARDAARARTNAALARYDAASLERARVRVAQRDLVDLLGL